MPSYSEKDAIKDGVISIYSTKYIPKLGNCTQCKKVGPYMHGCKDHLPNRFVVFTTKTQWDEPVQRYVINPEFIASAYYENKEERVGKSAKPLHPICRYDYREWSIDDWWDDRRTQDLKTQDHRVVLRKLTERKWIWITRYEDLKYVFELMGKEEQFGEKWKQLTKPAPKKKKRSLVDDEVKVEGKKKKEM